MNIVLDTNILLVSVSPTSQFYWLFHHFLNETYTLCVTTDILMEYEEILNRFVGEELSDTILQIIENAPNTQFVTKYYQWNLIVNDPDDNKFVDCAIAANAKFLVSHDKHFNVLKDLAFPKIKVISAEAFKKELAFL